MTFLKLPVDPLKDREAWLMQRRSTIGASDVAAIMGLSPYASPFTVWAEKTQGATKEQTEAMTWGLRLEDLILDAFEERKGLFAQQRQLMVANTATPWATATLDAVATETVDGPPLGPVEAKSDGGFTRWDGVPPHHVIQTQWQLFVTGWTQAWLAVLHGRRLEVYEVERDQALINKLLDAVHEFRMKHLQPDSPPPDPDGSRVTAASISDLWDDPTDDTVELSQPMVADLDRLIWLKNEKKKLDTQITQMENRLKVSLQNATTGTVDGEKAITWKETNRAGYTVKPARYRRFNIAKRKETT